MMNKKKMANYWNDSNTWLLTEILCGVVCLVLMLILVSFLPLIPITPYTKRLSKWDTKKAEESQRISYFTMYDLKNKSFREKVFLYNWNKKGQCWNHKERWYACVTELMRNYVEVPSACWGFLCILVGFITSQYGSSRVNKTELELLL